MSKTKNSLDRRSAERTPCHTPLMVKICKEKTISQIMQGYTQDVSKNGIRCIVTAKVPIGSVLWLKLDKDAILLCEEIERKAVILQQGILGKVIWVNKLGAGKFDIGLKFITRETTQPHAF